MISAHQPTLFDESVIAGVSSAQDGNMRFKVFGSNESVEDIVAHRSAFLSQLEIDINQTVLVYVTYEGDDYTRFASVNSEDRGRGMLSPDDMTPADALGTNESGVALFLPLADCVGAIIYDPLRHALMVSHLGRHSTIQDGARKNVEYLATHYGCEPNDLQVWLSPSVSQGSYKMDYFDYKEDERWREFCQEADEGVYLDLAGFNRQSFIDSGVRPGNIQVSNVDTATDPEYPSHVGGDNSRFAIVAMMR